ncbi:Soluble lytic murein transglycosylase precursor [hydrothermal vent metagenome]|uniref:Soluble lytic murein transglycosylase n=1 Tax=hydrothermal vent metagenome TaxID=652676 RepID=A0A3B0ZVW4_9ZZZZ
MINKMQHKTLKINPILPLPDARPSALFFTVLSLLALMVLSAPAFAYSDAQKILTQRYQYEAAQRALRLGHNKTYRRLEQKLRAYPLHSYLKLNEYTRGLRHLPTSKIKDFINENAGTPVSIRLRHRWLNSLARRGRWQIFINNYYPNNDRRMQCYFATALLKTKQTSSAYAVLEGLWLTKKSLPKQCDSPIRQWYKSGQLSKALIWQRIHLTMRGGRARLARYLARHYLPKNERFWVKMWSKIRRNPEYIIKAHAYFPEKARPEMLRWMIADGLARMARKDPPQAAKLWQKLKPVYNFTADERERILRRLSIALLKENTDEARGWIVKLDVDLVDDKLSSWHVMTAVRDQDWASALDWINRLSPELQQKPKWFYWRARALEAVGELDEARSYYLVNTDSRNYYGFLAADRIGQVYRLSHRPVNFSTKAMDKLEQIPAILRARELLALKRAADARREWNYAVARMSYPQMLTAARLASEWQWPDRAIQTLAQAKYWDDLELRFPLTHQALVINQAQKQNINPAWAFAVIRQESAFTPDAKSHAGALGLMQLMPRTARQVARRLRLRMRSTQKALLNINTNVRLGVSYLKRVADRYNGHPVLATAAYNAGTSRVKSWLPEVGTSLPADLWVEMVPFNETRKYLKRVLTYTVIYEKRLGLPSSTLLERMQPIARELTIAKQRASKVPAS